MNTNVKTTKPISYSCAICGSVHETIEARNTCEAKCIKERKHAEELMRKQKLEEEKDARKKKIEEMYDTLNNEIKNYVKDYGSIRLNRSTRYNGECPTLSNLFDFWSL